MNSLANQERITERFKSDKAIFQIGRRKQIFNILILLSQLLILFVIALPNGLDTRILYSDVHKHIFVLTTFNSSTDIVKIFGLGDQACYLLGAQKFLSGWLHGSDNWFLACWPPGFFLIESFFFSLFGTNCPIIVCLLVTTIICWTSAIWNLYLTFTQWQSSLKAAILSTALCFTQLFAIFFLHTSLGLSDSISTALVILSLSFAARTNKSNTVMCLLAAICLAAAAYIRAQIELLATCLFILTLLVIVAYFISSPAYRNFIRHFNINKFINIPVHRLFLIAIFAQLLMLPYRINNYSQFGTFAWVRGDYYWQLMWRSDAKTLQNNGKFAVLGGIAIPAKLNPKLALEIENNNAKFGTNYYSCDFYKRTTIDTFMQQPIQWLLLKAKYLPYSWFDNYYGPEKDKFQVENWFYAIIFWPILVISLLRIFLSGRHFYQNIIADLYFISIFCSLFICSIFLHFEPRYFYLLKTASLITALFYIAIYYQPTRTAKAQHKSLSVADALTR